MIDTPRDDTDAQIDAEETEFSNDHPLASPNELAGDAMSGVEMEFIARDIAEADAGALPLGTDATGAASGMALDDEGEEDTLPLEGN
nr:hypothetical protein [uncultured Sphingomonas sp.]